jgi:threonine synthase
MHVAVPTGNFGDILAARYAKEMGLPTGRLVCASNANKVLADFFATGIYDRRRDLVKTESPSMDILISSNLERLLYMATRSDPLRTASLMARLENEGWFRIDSSELAVIADFSSGWCGDQSARATIASVWETDRILVDPHTATAIEVASRVSASLSPAAPVVVAATASPYKFPRACSASLTGKSPSPEEQSDFEIARRIAAMTGTSMPPSLAALETRTVHHDRLIDPGELEAALAGYAREKMRGEP